MAGVAVAGRHQVEDLAASPLALFAFFAFFAVTNLCFRDGEVPALTAKQAVKQFETQITQRTQKERKWRRS
jgi:hypothetical protein